MDLSFICSRLSIVIGLFLIIRRSRKESRVVKATLVDVVVVVRRVNTVSNASEKTNAKPSLTNNTNMS